MNANLGAGESGVSAPLRFKVFTAVQLKYSAKVQVQNETLVDFGHGSRIHATKLFCDPGFIDSSYLIDQRFRWRIQTA
jgi:hypothetical protein